MVDGKDYLFSHLLGLQHHRIMEVATEQSGINKAWAYVSKVNV